MYSMYEEIHIAGWPSFCMYRDMAYALGPEVNIDGASMKQFGALRAVQDVQFSVDVNDAIKLDGEGNFSDAQNAELFHDAVKGALATLKLSVSDDRDAVDVMNKVNISTGNNSVKVNLEMSKADVEKLMQRGRGLAMR